MSITIYVVACREITDSDRQLIALYNGLLDHHIKPPAELVSQLKSILGDGSFEAGDHLPVFEPAPGSVATVELDIEGEGDVLYEEGMLIQITDLPPHTVALRIYSSV